MKTYFVTELESSKTSSKKGLIAGCLALAVLLGLCGIPFPGVLEDMELKKQINVLENQQDALAKLQEEIKELNLPFDGVSKERVRKRFPYVDSIFTLRNLLLAQADLTGILVKDCSFSPAIATDVVIPEANFPTCLGRTEMKLHGAAPFDNFLLFLHMLEETEFTYLIKDLKLDFQGLGDNGISYSLDLYVFFRAHANHLKPKTEKKDVDFDES